MRIQSYKLALLASLIIFLQPPIDIALAQPANPNESAETRLREYFFDIPVMVSIAKCETNFRQFSADGQALKDATGTYIGLFQIDEQAHFMNAWGMNFNLYTLEGNMAYARHLYGKLGTAPWKGCVGNLTAAPPTTISNVTTVNNNLKITKNLRMGMTDQQVQLLQQLLNKSGFIVATFGPGSTDHETATFGQLTREAVRKFQCAKKIVCDGNEAITGFGRIGPKTRIALTMSVAQE